MLKKRKYISVYRNTGCSIAYYQLVTGRYLGTLNLRLACSALGVRGQVNDWRPLVRPKQ
jgi:hypothetical protein